MNLSFSLMVSRVQHTIKIKCYSGIKCVSQYQQRNLCKLQKKRIGSIRFTIVMGNQDISWIWEILKILNIFITNLYLMLSPLMLENIYLIMKVMNMLRKEGVSQIIIHLIPCMLTLHNIKSKIWMLISSKTSLGK